MIKQIPSLLCRQITLAKPIKSIQGNAENGHICIDYDKGDEDYDKYSLISALWISVIISGMFSFSENK